MQIPDNDTIHQVIAPADFEFSHGDFALWDTSQFTVNGQITYGAAPQGIVGDYNNNGQVEQGDLDLVLLNWSANLSAPWGTGNVDQAELDGVLLYWGNVAALGSTAGVPEPSAIGLLLVAAGLGFGLVRKR